MFFPIVLHLGDLNIERLAIWFYYNLTLSADGFLCWKSVEFLGHVVSRDGIQTDPDKKEKIKNWP